MRESPSAKETTYLLAQHGPELWTREEARKIRAQVERQLDRLPAGATLVLDAKGVKVFDFSFANELFGRLVHDLHLARPPRFIVVEHMEPYARENLEKALESLGLAIVERRGGKLSLLGKKGPADEETFREIARARKPMTATALSEKMGTNLTAMNERLAKLARLGLVHRDKVASQAGREQYEYSAPR